MRSSRFRTLLLAGCAGLALSPAFARAQSAERTAFNIPAQDLGTALTQFGQQSEREIVFSTDLTRNRRARPVTGEMTTAEALTVLLADSGLSHRTTAAGAIIVEAAPAPQSGSAAGGGAEVEALIVTAQKREEDIQDVPIAISAFTQEALERSQVAGGPDLMTQVPNMTFTKTNFTSYSIQLRGIGTQAISATTDNAVAVAFNNTPFIRNRFFEQEFYDLQRVEVLRGPQGTLYGRNATAGVVNLISQKPKFAYEAKASGDVSNYNSTRVEGMLNVPLVDDVVALRVAGAWTKREGFVTNELTGNPIDGRDLWSTRVSLRFTPSDRIDANLIWEHFEEDDDRLRSGKQLCHTDEVTQVAGFAVTHFQTLQDYANNINGGFNGVQGNFSQGCAPSSLYSSDSFEVPNGLSLPYYGALSAQALPAALDDPYVSTTQSHDLRVIESTVDPIYKAKSDVVELQASFDVTDNLTLASETAYGVDEIFSMQDFNRFNTAPGAWDTSPDSDGSPNFWVESGILSPDGFFCDPQIGCADRLVGIDVSTARSRHFSQEFRLSSAYDGAFNFSLGANFLRYDTEDKYYVFFNSLTMYSASTGTDIGLWNPGVSDNAGCLPNGYQPPNVDKIQDILGCVYIDPNPVTSLNDMGHNYFLSRNPYKLISYAVFGEAYYQVAENLKLTGGLRWTVDKKEAPRIPSWVLGADTVGYPIAEVVEQEWNEPTGRIALDWKPDLSFTDETMVYASYAHGYKAGGMNPPPAGIVLRSTSAPSLNDSGFLDSSATHPKTFAPEFIDAFELGMKNTLLDGRLTLNLAGFYYDYKGYQISQIVNRSAVNLNFDTDVWGLELEGDWRPAENLRFGLKLGYENTKVAEGSRAIDLMDRTAGNSDWVVIRPFPTLPSNCVLPAWLLVGNMSTAPQGGTNPALVAVGGRGGGNPGGCEEAYILGRDPVTGRISFPFPFLNPDPNDPNGTLGPVAGDYFRTDIDYAAWSTDLADYPCWPEGVPLGREYPGVDPACLAALSNGGAGFYKDLSGNELPNAPNLTATLTADYTVPLPNEWLMTLHTDLYYQSEAWTRIFNTEGYDKLKAYTNVNLAAIFANEDAGWKVMAYVKNVFDRDSITGAFLNSDDTGLTTNVFLTEPRLYGLRVTKEFTGGPWWTGASAVHTGPYPLTIEVGGQVQRHDAPYQTMTPSWVLDPDTGESILPASLDPMAAQNRDFDRGDGRDLKLTFRPGGSPWFTSAAVRYGRTNSDQTRVRQDDPQDRECRFLYDTPFGKAWCVPGYSLYGAEPGRYYSPAGWKSVNNWADGAARSRESHSIVDFEVGRDVGMGAAASTVALGLRYATFDASTVASMATTPDAVLPDGWFKYEATASRFVAEREAEREFKGFGPTLSWDGAVRLLGGEDTGQVNLELGVTGGVLFGKQKTHITGFDQSGQVSAKYYNLPDVFPMDEPIPVDIERSRSTTTPLVDLSLGLSYDVGRIKVGAGYRWERYFDVLDVGAEEAQDADRTIDGPYFKIAVGFGG